MSKKIKFYNCDVKKLQEKCISGNKTKRSSINQFLNPENELNSSKTIMFVPEKIDNIATSISKVEPKPVLEPISKPVDNRDQIKIFLCYICNVTFNNSDCFSIHLDFHKTGLYKCRLCSNQYLRPANLNEHISLFHNQKRFLYECDICFKKYSYKRSLDYHKEKHNNKIYTCESCDKKFKDLKSLKVHNRLHTKIGLEQCDLCGKKFTRKYNLKSHLIRCATYTETCEKCFRRFANKKLLRKHHKKCKR